MSSVPLRVRLIMVLAVVMVAPLLVAGVILGFIVPGVADLAVPLLVSAAAAGLLGALLVGFVAVGLERPLAELDAAHEALSDTFGRFGEALGHTHHLDGLLAAVVDAAVHGSAADAGAAWIVAPSGGPAGGGAVDPDAAPPTAAPSATDHTTLTMPELHERVATPGAPAGPLGSFARRAAQTDAEVRQARAPGEPVVAAMPLRDRSGRVVGVLAVARVPGSAGFDDDELERVRALSSQAGTAIVNLRLHEETRLQSVTDPLTGAGNFRQLSSTLSKEVERASRYSRPLSVLMLDLDHFKQVNDTLGHAFGDFVLQEVARRLTGCLREGDTLARRGGEEFTVVLPETDSDGACVAASRILDAVRDEPFGMQGRLRVVTLSAGVASFPAHGTTASELLGSADAALYAAKAAGRNRWALANGPGSTLATTHAG